MIKKEDKMNADDDAKKQQRSNKTKEQRNPPKHKNFVSSATGHETVNKRAMNKRRIKRNHTNNDIYKGIQRKI